MTPPSFLRELPPDRRPAVVAHADWSLDGRKRWLTRAVAVGGDRYIACAPELVGPLGDFFERLGAAARRTGPLLVGFDFPLGLPRAYARKAGIESFRGFLAGLGQGAWPDFFSVAERAEEVRLGRPFFPRRATAKGNVTRSQLIAGLGVARYVDLLRLCDLGHGRRRDACALFWTLGAQQVGKAAIVGWRDLLLPAFAGGRDLALWPFDGELHELLASRDTVVAETYPAEIYGHLGLVLGPGGKRDQAARAILAPQLLAVAAELGVDPNPALAEALADGFGAPPDGEDPFDAVVGLLGMLNVLRGKRPPGTPPDEETRQIEGWILGQTAAGTPPRTPFL